MPQEKVSTNSASEKNTSTEDLAGFDGRATLEKITSFFSAHWMAVSWGALVVLVMSGVTLLYASKLLNLDPNLGLATGEYQLHVGFITLFRRWLQGEIAFPLWNPVMGYGRSLIADPFLFVYNPFLSVPMFLFGVVNGTKMALVLNFIIAGVGMYILARSMGLSRVTSLWCGLLYMMSGALPSHLIIGQIQLTFSLGWAPWAAASIVRLIRSPGWGTACATALSQALFFFSGNLYHQVYALFTFLIISVIFIVDWKDLNIDKELAKYILVAGALSLGLIAIQLLPLMAARTSMDNIGGYALDSEVFPGSQLMEYAFLNYIVADPDFSRTDILNQIPCPQENYRYIGIAPVLLLLFLIPAFQVNDRRMMAAMALSFLFLLAWAALEYSFIRDLYEFFPILYQFRDPGRALSVGTVYLIALSGFGLDYLWDRIRDVTATGDENVTWYDRRPFRVVVSAFVAAVLIFALRRVYGENRGFITLEHLYRPEIGLAVDWLTEREEEPVTIQTSNTVASKIIFDAYEVGLRSQDFIDGWRPSAPAYTIGRFSALPYAASYRLDWDYEGLTDPGYEIVRRFGELRIAEAEQGFPYAFVVPLERLVQTQPVLPQEVDLVGYVRHSNPNRIIVDLEVQEQGMLVVAESWFDGWRVQVDREEATLAPVGSFLAVEVSPGVHHVVFEYAPRSFTVGWIISLATVMVMLSGKVIRWRKLKASQ